MKVGLWGTLCVIVLAACAPSTTEDQDAELVRQLSGSTLENDTTTIMLAENGNLTATYTSPRTNNTFNFTGTWEIKDRQFCRTLDQNLEGIPADLCEWVTVNGATVAFDGLEPDGRLPVEYAMR